MTIVIIILSSCSLVSSEMVPNDTKTTAARFGLMVEAIESHDKNAVKSMFSTQVLTQSVDFEAQLEHLFEFIQGQIESWERTGGPGVSEDRNDDGSGRIWKEIRTTYDIKTSEQKYHISFQEITKHSQCSDKIGVSSFCIISADDWDKDYNYWGDLGLPEAFGTLGIFIEDNISF